MPIMKVNKTHLLLSECIPVLADPNFEMPADIEIMLGSDVLGDILQDGRIHDNKNNKLYAHNQPWMGHFGTDSIEQPQNNIRATVVLTSSVDLDTTKILATGGNQLSRDSHTRRNFLRESLYVKILPCIRRQIQRRVQYNNYNFFNILKHTSNIAFYSKLCYKYK